MDDSGRFSRKTGRSWNKVGGRLYKSNSVAVLFGSNDCSLWLGTVHFTAVYLLHWLRPLSTSIFQVDYYNSKLCCQVNCCQYCCPETERRYLTISIFSTILIQAFDVRSVFSVRPFIFCVRVRSCSVFHQKSVFVFVRVRYFSRNQCSCSFMFDRTRTNTRVRSLRIRVLSSLAPTAYS